jgi:hypothetical protein
MENAKKFPDLADHLTISSQIDAIKAETMASSPYSLAAKSKLFQLGLPQLVASGAEGAQ